MGLKSFFSAKSYNPDAIEKQEDGTFFYPFGASASFNWGDIGDIQRVKYFSTVPELNAIIMLRARATGNMKIITVDKNTEKEVTVNNELVNYLKEPNYFQSMQEFFGQTNLFNDIFGTEYIYPVFPLGVKSPSGVFSLPSDKIEMEISSGQLSPFYLYNSVPDEIKIRYKHIDGKYYDIDKTRLVISTLTRALFNKYTDYLKGMSKIDPLQGPLENILAAYEARNVLIVNRGAIGILSNATRDGIGQAGPLDDKEKERIQEEFKRYGLTKGQWQIIITNLALNWKQMAIDVDKLKLFDETREDTLKICDRYGTPIEILSAIRNTTFDNKREAQRQWYRDTIIPEAAQRMASINNVWFKNESFRVIAKFDHLPIFEEERKDRSRALLLTVNALTKALADKAITTEQYAEELRRFGIK